MFLSMVLTIMHSTTSYTHAILIAVWVAGSTSVVRLISERTFCNRPWMLVVIPGLRAIMSHVVASVFMVWWWCTTQPPVMMLPIGAHGAWVMPQDIQPTANAIEGGWWRMLDYFGSVNMRGDL